VALSITLEQALARCRHPSSSAAGGARPPLATFGEDPVSGRKIVLKEGKFGFYVTTARPTPAPRGDDHAD